MPENYDSAEEQNKAREEEQNAELSDMRTVLQTDAGRRVFWRLMERCHIYHSTATGNSTMYIREGERRVGLFVLDNIINADPEAYFRMMRENIKHLQKEGQKNG